VAKWVKLFEIKGGDAVSEPDIHLGGGFNQNTLRFTGAEGG
jgi:hypothetical protein